MVRRLDPRQCALKTLPSIPRFPASSLDARKCVWTAEDLWEEAEKRAFFAWRQGSLPAAVSEIPRHVDARRKAPATVLMRYLLAHRGELSRADLADPEKRARASVAAAEVHGYGGVFRTVRLLLSACTAPGGWAGEKEALALLVSACCLMAEADRVTLIPLDQACAEQLARLDWGQERPVLCPRSETSALFEMHVSRRGKQLARAGATVKDVPLPRASVESPFFALSLRDITPAEWWLTVHGAESRQALGYLEKRIAREKRTEAASQRRRPRMSALEKLAKVFLGR